MDILSPNCVQDNLHHKLQHGNVHGPPSKHFYVRRADIHCRRMIHLLVCALGDLRNIKYVFKEEFVML